MKVIILFEDINEAPIIIYNYDSNFKILGKSIPEVLIVNDVALGYKEHLETWNIKYQNVIIKDLEVIKLIYQYEKIAKSANGETNYMIEFPDEYSLIDDDIIERLNPTIIPKQLKSLDEEIYYFVNPSIIEQVNRGLTINTGSIRISKRGKDYYISNKKKYNNEHEIISQLQKKIEIRIVILLTKISNYSRGCC